MSGVNKVILVGNLGGDVELKFTQGGQPVANFNLATSERWSDKDGNKQERTEWHRIVVWGKLAELCGEYLAKGRKAYIEGAIQTRSYEKDGTTRYVTEIKASEVVFLDSKQGEPAPRQAPASTARPPAKPVTQVKPAPRHVQDGGFPGDEDDIPF